YAEAWESIGFAYILLGEKEKAIAFFQKAADINPDDAGIWTSIALYHAERGEYKKAMKYLEKSLEIDPEFTEAWNFQGLGYADLGDLGSAVESFQRATKTNPRFGDAWYNLGWTYGRLGNYTKAIECYKKVLKIDPNHSIAKKALEEDLRRHPKYREEKREAPPLKVKEAPPIKTSLFEDRIREHAEYHSEKERKTLKETGAQIGPSSTGSTQEIYCYHCNSPIKIFLPPEVLAGRDQLQTVKTCTNCRKRTSIAVLMVDGKLNWQIGEST
ncbi:MAG: tetratricopeptide repeat protein, partial [Promethearchaeota archaeon]